MGAEVEGEESESELRSIFGVERTAICAGLLSNGLELGILEAILVGMGVWTVFGDSESSESGDNNTGLGAAAVC